jgi:lipopolysaccharide biosynthesis protein
LFHTVFPSWDNESRKPEQGYTFANSTPNEYQAWLETAIKATLDNTNMDERIVFINAWNEWAEGAYLEPDRKFGYAYLQATMEALKSAEQLEEPQNEFDTYG